MCTKSQYLDHHIVSVCVGLNVSLTRSTLLLALGTRASSVGVLRINTKHFKSDCHVVHEICDVVWKLKRTAAQY
jgi:hypothetical protein